MDPQVSPLSRGFCLGCCGLAWFLPCFEGDTVNSLGRASYGTPFACAAGAFLISATPSSPSGADSSLTREAWRPYLPDVSYCPLYGG